MQKDDEEEKTESQNRQDQMSSRKTNVIAMWRHKNRCFLLGGRAEEGSYKVYLPGLVFVISMRIMVVTNVRRMPKKKSDIILDSYRKKEKRCIYL